MNERARKVEALGGALLDYLPQPRQPSNTLETEPGSSGQFARRVPCPACGARGRVLAPGVICARCSPRTSPTRDSKLPYRAHSNCKPCLACEGSGWRRARAGEEGVDEYLSTSAGGGNRKPWEESKDAERRLERTNKLLRLWEHPEEIGFAWEERREAQFRSGSFRELEVALNRLAAQLPNRFKMWWRIVVCHDPVTMTERGRAALSETSALLAAWMPDAIRVPPHLQPERATQARRTSLERGRTPGHTRQRAERDREILHQRKTLGWPASRIARYHSLDKRRVNQILANVKEPADENQVLPVGDPGRALHT